MLKAFLLSLCLLFAVCFAISCAAQLQSPLPPQLGQQTQGDHQPQDSWERQKKEEMRRQENLERQEEIKKDTDQLLALATELKQSVDKTNQGTLSLDVIRKAEQIEKLAKSVKQKMKGPS